MATIPSRAVFHFRAVAMPSPGDDVSVCKTANISDQPLNACAKPSPSRTRPLIGCPPLLITSSRRMTRPVLSMHRIVGEPRRWPHHRCIPQGFAIEH